MGEQDTAAHWDGAYAARADTRSWFERYPARSLAMLERAGVTAADSVIDVGGGVSPLAGALLDRGFQDVTVLDISPAAIRLAWRQLGTRAGQVQWLVADLRGWQPERQYQAWHDRAVLHFMATAAEQQQYAQALDRATGPGAVAVIGCFAPDGPPECSGLPVARYGPADLTRLLGDGWALLAADREEHRTPADVIQPFTWAALQKAGLAGPPRADRATDSVGPVLDSPEQDPARPTPAGIYDYLLGGEHHSAADRAAAEQALALTPANRTEVIENRAFLRRAVHYLAGQGITQYVDLGSGYPASGAVHQTAAELITRPRVVYVDNDPRVAEVSRGLLDSPDTAVIVRDVRRPAEVIGDPQTQRLIDWSRPVAVLMVAILHFIQDGDDPAGIVAAFREQLAPGSYLVLSHGVVLDDPEFCGEVAQNWDRAASGVRLRTPAEVAGFLAGFDLVPPGLVTTVEWGTDRPPTTGPGAIMAAVGTVPG